MSEHIYGSMLKEISMHARKEIRIKCPDVLCHIINYTDVYFKHAS